MDFDINNLTIEDHVKLDLAMKKAVKDYSSAGYVKPVYATSLITDAYNQILEKETVNAFKANKDGVSQKVSEKIEFMEKLTEVKLYNTLLSSFKKGEESIEFCFSSGKPDKQTADFFNLEDVAGIEINSTRTNNIRLPKSFHCEKECTLTITPQGEILCVDDKVYDTFEPFKSLGLEQPTVGGPVTDAPVQE